MLNTYSSYTILHECKGFRDNSSRLYRKLLPEDIAHFSHCRLFVSHNHVFVSSIFCLAISLYIAILNHFRLIQF